MLESPVKILIKDDSDISHSHRFIDDEEDEEEDESEDEDMRMRYESPPTLDANDINSQRQLLISEPKIDFFDNDVKISRSDEKKQ
jgi:hypothetical protein